MSETTKTSPCLVGEFRPVTEITVPIEGAGRYERSLAVAAQLAERWGLPVRIVHVRVGDDPVDFDVLEGARAAFSHRHPDIPVAATLIAHDDVAVAVEAVAPPSALVVMSSEHADRGPISSMAERILRSTGLAMLVGPNADSEHLFGPVTVALDGSPTAEGALEAAIAFAESFGGQVELAEVIEAATTAHVEKLRARGERVSESGYLRSVVDRLEAAGHRVGWEVVHAEDAIDGLLAVAKARGGGPIVVGSHGHSDLAHRMLGSTAMGLVGRHTHPVLVVSTRRDSTELGLSDR